MIPDESEDRTMDDLVKDGEKEGAVKRAAILRERIENRGDTEFNEAAKERNEKDQAELQEIGSRLAAGEKAKKEEAEVKEVANEPIKKAEAALNKEKAKVTDFETK